MNVDEIVKEVGKKITTESEIDFVSLKINDDLHDDIKLRDKASMNSQVLFQASNTYADPSQSYDSTRRVMNDDFKEINKNSDMTKHE